jgi:uncharacterized protein (DUF433 family)
MVAEQSLAGAFSEGSVSRLSGLSVSQLRRWARIGFFRPSLALKGVAHGQLYSFRDVVALRVLGRLRNQHAVPLQHLRAVGKKLAERGIESWAGVKLYPVNRKVVWLDPESERPAEIVSGQYVQLIELDHAVDDTRAAVMALNRRGDQATSTIARRRGVAGGAAVIEGTRVPASAVLAFKRAGYSLAQVQDEFPGLSLSDLKAAWNHREAA